MWNTVISWLIRTFDASALRVGTLLFASALSIGLLLDADKIEAVRANDHPIWPTLVRPVAWALLIACVGVAARLLCPLVRVALSPTFRFRRMAGDVDALAQSLSNCQKFDNGMQGVAGPPLPRLELEIAALKGQLETVGVRSPPISDLEAWRDYLPLLRAWVASGNLRTARWYQPGLTAIVDYR